MADCKDVIPKNGLIHRIGYSIVLTPTNAWVNPVNLASKAFTLVSILGTPYYFSVFVLNSSVSCNVDYLVSLKNSLLSIMSLQSALTVLGSLVFSAAVCLQRRAVPVMNMHACSRGNNVI